MISAIRSSRSCSKVTFRAEAVEASAGERVRGLEASDAYRGLQQLEDLRGRVTDSEQRAGRDEADAQSAAADGQRARMVATEADERRRRVSADHDRAATEAMTAAAEAGVAGPDPALVESRRLEVTAVRATASAWDRAEHEAGQARGRADQAAERVEAAAQRRRAAESGADQARAAWRQDLAAWADGTTWLDVTGLAQLADAIDVVGEPGASSPGQVLADLVCPHRDRLVEQRTGSTPMSPPSGTRPPTWPAGGPRWPPNGTKIRRSPGADLTGPPRARVRPCGDSSTSGHRSPPSTGPAWRPRSWPRACSTPGSAPMAP